MRVSLGHLYIDEVEGKGRGVHSYESFSIGDIIEVCPMLVLGKDDRPHIESTFLYNYFFEWGENSEYTAIALGYGSIYNHAAQANAQYEMDFKAKTLTIFCVRPIRAGEEITINYNGEIDNTDKVWFEL